MTGEHPKSDALASNEQLIQYLRVSLELAEKSDGLAYIASVPLKQVIELLEGAAVETFVLPSCRADGGCATMSMIAAMCEPCQVRYYRDCADKIESGLRKLYSPVETSGEPHA